MTDSEDLASQVNFAGQLQAVHTDEAGASDLTSTDLKAVHTDDVNTTDEAIGQLTSSAGDEKAFRLEAPNMSSAVDVDLQLGVVSSRTRGRPRNKALAELRIGEILLGKLNELGGEWLAVEPGEDDRGEDVVLKGPGDPPARLVIQVTMVDARKWAAAVRGTATSHSTTDQLADEVLTAIQRHSQMVTSGVVLALDAMNGDAHGLRAVVESFRLRHLTRASAFGWREIWLVGMDSVHTVRLSP